LNILGANICEEVLKVAAQYEVADIVHFYYNTINTEIFTYIKKFMGKISFQVHDKCLFSATVVPRDQNMVEIVIPPVDIYRPGVFLTLFAAHGDYLGYGPDFQIASRNLRLHGNPCKYLPIMNPSIRTLSVNKDKIKFPL